MADANEQQDALNPDVETNDNQETVTMTAAELAALTAEKDAAVADAEAKKKYADRIAIENRNLKKAATTETTNEGDQPPSDERFERLELKTDGYSTDEVDFIMQNGGRASLSNRLVQSAIESQRKSAKSQDATPTGTAKSPIYQKYGERDLKNMKLEDLEKIIPQD